MLIRWPRTLIDSSRKVSSRGERRVNVSSATPRVGQGSILAVVAAVSPDDAVMYIASVEAEIRDCIDNYRLSDAAVLSAFTHEQIHRLKNSIAPIGSPELLHACEQLKLDAANGTGPSRFEQSYIAVAHAALNALLRFKTSGAGSRP